MTVVTAEDLYKEYLEENKLPISKTIHSNGKNEIKDDLKDNIFDGNYSDDDESLCLTETSSIIEVVDNDSNSIDAVEKSLNLLGLDTNVSTDSVNDIYIKLIHLLSKGDSTVNECVDILKNNYSVLNRAIISDIIINIGINYDKNDVLTKYIIKENNNNSSLDEIKKFLINYPYENENIVYDPANSNKNVFEEEQSKDKQEHKVHKDDDDEDWGWDDDLDIENIEVGDDNTKKDTIILPLPFIELMKIHDITNNHNNKDDWNTLLYRLLFKNIGFDDIESLVYLEKYITAISTSQKIDGLLYSMVEYNINNYLNDIINNMLLEITEDNASSSKDIIKIISYNINSVLLLEPLLSNSNIEYNKRYLIRVVNMMLSQIENTFTNLPIEYNFLIKNHLTDCFKKLNCGGDRDLMILLKEL
ncbi:hypothetical protein HANVADRAFT_53660 [Hanseniaspora valbyensis NRRL Y-1626]|uniref:Uncharacterized protein n=1 Tax=Hanseniaspora valbyensis NRRL Y-1626 TaxID=766949 RepID=A0A1B7TAR6_9ASCO|nr:hypothetical protein HANVADRAFT_53660 [Hanseniaspora valbyensis NRRL Y-1626]